ncbi:MAG: hypothetical protein CML03_04620 [Pseudooceanicola sp.]|nr:hypothetical protein [Pseudooceanicola sp.]|tara:strand:+ start:151 stop:504 length:354 start_codon:yes stop_codon:yes gene_type:complete
MRRDNDLIRAMLFKYEAEDDYVLFEPDGNALPGEHEHRERFHLLLMMDAGLATKLSAGTFRLTSRGMDFLEAIREDTAWNKIKRGAAKVGDVGLNLLVDMAIASLKLELEKRVGLKF